MEIWRDVTGETINRIFNDQSVKPLVIDDERFLDLSKIASDPRGYAMIGEPPLGAYVLWPVIEGVYEFHVGVLPPGRGPWAIDFSAATIDYMFCATDCVELITRLPHGAVASRALAQKFRFVARWECPSTRYLGKEVPYTVVSLTMFDWMPAEDSARNMVFAQMQRWGMGKKASSWYQRWALLSAAEQAH